MLLTKYVLKKIKEQLDGAGIVSYLYIAPQSNTSEPFATIFAYSVTTEYCFNEIIESVNVQVSLFSNNSNCENLLDTGSTIYNLFKDYSVNDGTHTIFCTHVTNQIGPTYLDKEHFWQYVMELEFKCQIDK